MNTTNKIQSALKKLGIDRLNAMQQAALEAARENKDIVLLSPTGSGKTLAYLLPMLDILKEGKNGVQVLILVPSRELALQTESVFKSMGTDFTMMSCYGGRPAAEEKKTMLGICPDLIVGTPGRLNDHLSKGNIDPVSIHTLVIDEFDKCLEFGFQEEMEEVTGYLAGLKKRVLLSATDAEEIPVFTGLGNTVRLDFLRTDASESRLCLRQVLSPAKDKLETLYKLLCCLGSDSTIVFCNHRDAADRVGMYLRSAGLYNEVFHGGMEQADRERALYKFRNGSCHVFVSTDLAARGLDIPEIKNIVHYHLPVNEEGYIHRNGRTARWDAAGNSYLILHGEEPVPGYVNEVPETMELPEEAPKSSQPVWVTLYIGRGKKDKLNKIDIAGFLYKKGKLNREDIGLIDIKDHHAYVAIRRKMLKQTLNLIKGEKIKGMRTVIEEST